MKAITTDAEISEAAAWARAIVVFKASWSGPSRRFANLVQQQEAVLAEQGIVYAEADFDAPAVRAWMRRLAPEEPTHNGVPWGTFHGNGEIAWLRFGRVFGFDSAYGYKGVADFFERTARYLP